MNPPIIDTNIHVSRWPFRRLPLDETPRLVAKLRGHGVVQAWAGSFDGLLHRDVAAVNQRLAEECRQHGDGLLIPFGTINPTLPDWKEELRRCHEEHRMPGLRLHPNYQGYKLSDPAFGELLELATERGLIVQIALLMEDSRTQHPLMQVPALDPEPLVALLKRQPQARIVLLNALKELNAAAAARLAEAGNVSFDIGTLERTGGLEKFIDTVSPERLLFGSHAPFFYFESALLKLRESPLGGKLTRMICEENARSLVK